MRATGQTIDGSGGGAMTMHVAGAPLLITVVFAAGLVWWSMFSERRQPSRTIAGF